MGYFDKYENWGPYKRLWTRFGGRPWTHISRDYILGRRFRVGILCCLCYGIGRLEVGHYGEGAILVVLAIILAHWLF